MLVRESQSQHQPGQPFLEIYVGDLDLALNSANCCLALYWSPDCQALNNV